MNDFSIDIGALKKRPKPASETAVAKSFSTTSLSRLAPSARPSSISAGQAPSTRCRSRASASGAGSQATTS